MSGRTIMVIDSDEASLTSTKNTLEGTGYRVLTRNRAPGSVAAILHEKPDLVMMELNLPGVSGFSIADMLWRAAPNSELVLVVYSKLPESTLKSKAREMGAEGFIPKGLSDHELVRRVQAFVRQGESSGKLRALQPRRAASTQLNVSDIGAALSSVEPPPASGAAPELDPLSARPERHPSGTHSALTRVMFVDDDVATLTEYRRQLPLEEIRAEFVMSGQVALTRLLGDTPPDVVVCELMMQGVSGAELYRRALGLDATWRHRFVFVSLPLAPATAARYARELQYEVLEKPVEPERLREALRYAVTGSRIFKQGIDG